MAADGLGAASVTSIEVPRTSARLSSVDRCRIATTGHGLASAAVFFSVQASVAFSATVPVGQVSSKSPWVTVNDESVLARPPGERS